MLSAAAAVLVTLLWVSQAGSSVQLLTPNPGATWPPKPAIPSLYLSSSQPAFMITVGPDFASSTMHAVVSVCPTAQGNSLCCACCLLLNRREATFIPIKQETTSTAERVSLGGENTASLTHWYKQPAPVLACSKSNLLAHTPLTHHYVSTCCTRMTPL